MIKKKKKTKPNFDEEIERTIKDLAVMDPTSKEYKDVVLNLEKIYKMKEIETNQIDINKVIMVAGNLLGIGMILVFEKSDIITSKALGFVNKIRL